MLTACGSLVPSTETSSLPPGSNNKIASVTLQYLPFPKSATVVDVSNVAETIPLPGSTEEMPDMHVSKHHRLVHKKDDKPLSLRLERFRGLSNLTCVVLLVLCASIFSPLVFVVGFWF